MTRKKFWMRLSSAFLSTAIIMSSILGNPGAALAKGTSGQKTEVAVCVTEQGTETEDYQTNLENLTFTNGTWEVREDGLYSNAVDQGDSFLASKTEGINFVYSTDVTFLQKRGAAALIFRDCSGENKECYAVNLSADGQKCKFWRWQDGADYQLVDEKQIEATEDNKYTLKVVAIDSWISYYVNDVLIASTGDYTLQPGNKGQSTCLTEGYFGLLNWDGEMVFQNTYCKEIDESFTPLLEDITVVSSRNKKDYTEEKTQFVSTEPITIQYVKNKARTVDVKVTAKNKKAKITVQDEKGRVYRNLKRIPVSVGTNYLTVTSSVKAKDGTEAKVVYRVNVHRRQADKVYYNEMYRDQYHYSVKDGWANDPNGLVYYNGTYHMFYQFYDDIKWGPMHWAHATSKDLIHWEEEPIALYPDANGAMFSGCIVADTENTSGLFDTDQGGLVALITADGNGQRIKVAYSKDEGMTWTKTDKIAADWTNDPLQDGAFRDPKVFRWEGKWFMVIAGGPLRIYSSDNLLQWKCESTYADLHTECPDLYPLQTADGTLKWVLSRGGRYYKVGDFKQVDGNWKFVPDEEYVSDDNVMNFGKDSYAAMTYYVQDFGTSENPTLPEIIELNWMNTWDDYCNKVAETVGQKFNGTFNLNLKLGLTQEDGKYVLTQAPIDAYESLRDTDNAVVLQDVDVTENNTLLQDFSGSCYEIVSTFRPSEGTKKVGFNLRTGNNEATVVAYDLETETLSIDRSKSGIIISSRFAQVDSQHVTKNEDGTIDLHIYVDKASVEVFTKGDTAAGANQIFPSASSLGAGVFAEGGAAKADITIYPMSGIWTDKVAVKRPVDIGSASAASRNVNVGDSFDLNVYLAPSEVAQKVIWTTCGKGVVSVKQENATLHVTAMKKGTAKITAIAKANPKLKKTFTVKVYENNFDTNIDSFTVQNGDWFINDETLTVSNTSSNDYYMTSDKIGFEEYTLETNIKYEKGLINIFFASGDVDPYDAYSLQFGSNENIRLYRFAGDTITEQSMGKTINDNQYHNIKVVKGRNDVVVYVDGEECLNHTFETVDEYYNDAYVGLGLWDGALEVQDFYVTEK